MRPNDVQTLVFWILSWSTLCLLYSKAAPITSNSIQQPLNYLQRYGYMAPLSIAVSGLAKMSSDSQFVDAILKFQRFAGLNQTGQLDDQTMKTMHSPRCGNTDFKIGIRVKRYVLEGSRWKRFNLTYQIVNLPYDMSRQAVANEFQKAFGIWASVSPLRFRRVTSKADINVAFYTGNHGDSDPFDGPGGTLAHAYFPRYGGDVHFDLDEHWTANSYSGTNLLQVATHEIGHALGLEHSGNRNALMAPFYQRFRGSVRLNSDDVKAIQAIYGSRVKPKYSRSRRRRKVRRRRIWS